MVNLNGSSVNHNESDNTGKSGDFLEDNNNNLIWTMKAIDYVNDDSQENLNRVHVLCCTKCDFLTISLKALHQHMVMLHSVPDEEFNSLAIYCCQECKCVSTEQKLIEEHIKIFHHILTENSSNSSPSDIVSKKSTILTPLPVSRNCRQSENLKLTKPQLKIRRKFFPRKPNKAKLKNLLNSDIDIENDDNNNRNSPTAKRENKMETEPPTDRFTLNKTMADNNDPLDMSIKSTTCPFKSIKGEPMNCNNYGYPIKQEPINNDTNDLLNSKNSNSLLSNPQTCIELIKLTLNQMLTKNGEQNRLSHIGFNPSSFLQPQFQLPSNIVPLILPTSAPNEISFNSKNPNIEAIIANIQQQNFINCVSPKPFDQNNQMMAYQQSALYLNNKLPVSSFNISSSPSLDNNHKNGILSISPLSVFTQKKSTDFPSKISNKRSLKRHSAATKGRGCPADEPGYLQSPKIENSNNENLFNRSFLDCNAIDSTNEQLDLSKSLEVNDHQDQHTNFSNKSSPNTLTNDKPHRQNFTSQQNRILTDWFFTHCDKPYPSTEDTKELSQLSGLSYSQVKKWFANKRARSSLNKKNHKSYSLTNPGGDSTMEDMTNNDALSVSPSSGSDKSYTNHTDAPEAIDFSAYNHEELSAKHN